jgi:hypothetical protein
MRTFLYLAVASTLVMGCKKKDGDAAGKGDKGGDKGAVTLPALTAEAAPTVTAADHPPFESVKFRMLDKRNDKGWPKFEAYNLGTKPIAFLAIAGYAYDKDGKQVAHTSVPLSWNGKLAPGGKTDWDIEVGSFKEDQIPASAATYELCYSSIKYDGDANSTDDNSKCPAEKPKSK